MHQPNYRTCLSSEDHIEEQYRFLRSEEAGPGDLDSSEVGKQFSTIETSKHC